MKNLKDDRTTILPSTTRGGKELPSSSALDSPSVISKHETPKPATAMNSDMSHVIDDATSAMHDETTSVRDTTLKLGEFLDEQLSRVGGMKLLKMLLLMIVMMKVLPLIMNYLLFLRVMLWKRKLLELSLLVKIDMILKSY